MWRTTWGRRTSAELLRLDGHERAVLGRDRDPRSQWPPYALFGFGPSEVAPGTVTGEMPVTGWLLDSRGELGAPLLAFVADAPLTTCVDTLLPPGMLPVTATLRLEVVERPSRDDRTLRCTAERVAGDDRSARSSGRMHGDDGTLQAIATARQTIRSLDVGRLPPLPSAPPLRDDADLPFMRPPEGEPVPADVWARCRPLDVLRDQMIGRQPLPPLSHLTGMRTVAAGEGRVLVVLPAMHWLDTPVFAGALGLLAATAIELAADSGLEAGQRAALLDLSCHFLRPGTGAGPDIEAHARTLHVGGDHHVVDCEVRQGRRTLATARAGLERRRWPDGRSGR